MFLQPLNDPVGALVFAQTGAGVDAVLVDGRPVLSGGRPTTVDEQALFARAAEAAERLRRRNGAEWEVARRLTPYLAQACRSAAEILYPVNRYAADPASAGPT